MTVMHQYDNGEMGMLVGGMRANAMLHRNPAPPGEQTEIHRKSLAFFLLAAKVVPDGGRMQITPHVAFRHLLANLIGCRATLSATLTAGQGPQHRLAPAHQNE
jgi:hypothetical protein